MKSLRRIEVAEPQRLDHFLRHEAQHHSLRHIRRVIAAGEVRVNGQKAKKGTRLRSGDIVTVDAELVAIAALRPQAEMSLTILYQDSEIIAVDKPSGIASIAQRPDDLGTVANFLLARFPHLTSIGSSGESGIVHRLDTATSGVLVAALTPSTHHALRASFSANEVRKTYRAIVSGKVSNGGTIDHPLRSNRKDKRRVEVTQISVTGARQALTRYRPLHITPKTTHLAVEIQSGARHQIRAHLASIGHPVIGDELYGPTGLAQKPPNSRLMLHAKSVEFTHPSSGKEVAIDSPLPPDFEADLNLESGNISAANPA